MAGIAGDLRPAARHWRLQRALALLQLGRDADAKSELDAFEQLGPVPREIVPLWRWRRVLIALAFRDEAQARENHLDRTPTLLCNGQVIGPNLSFGTIEASLDPLVVQR